MTNAPPDLQNLPSQYDHQAAQAKWYKVWEERGYFHAEVGAKDAAGNLKAPYTIVIPPPNVTGALHLGHALNNTLQDILIRMKRMQGFNTLWMPGTDHAGIATQAVVERRLFEEQKLTRHELGREGLLERIWAWKDQYEKRIIGQLKRLGCSCDWQRTRFTLDDQCARAVRETFFRLFKDGKIYRGKRLVNWDTFLQTAVSDDEVYHETVKGSFWHFRYPVVPEDRIDGDPEFVTIATTRPETMLGDTAVAVHPEPAKAFDKAIAELHEKVTNAPAKEKAELAQQEAQLLERRGKMLPQLERLRDMAQRRVRLELPLTGRTIPLIADVWAKPELGSGAVKITPAHDENDYAVGQRNPEIGSLNIMRPDGTIGEGSPDIPLLLRRLQEITDRQGGQSLSLRYGDHPTSGWTPEEYRDKTMDKVRLMVVADLEAIGLYDPKSDREDREIDLAFSDRSKKPIEPFLVEQWFMRMGDDSSIYSEPGLSQLAIDAVEDGRVQITPSRYAKSYCDWLREKRDWPIGRQLWWGHRIPVWSVEFSSIDDDKEPQFQAGRARQWLDAMLRDLGVSEGELAWWSPEKSNEPKLYVCTASEQAANALTKIDNALNGIFNGPDESVQAGLRFFASVGRELPDESALFINRIPQEEDVLDTWFSSALWPHSTLGWPDQTPELAEFYPTSTLVTSRDIISLWVARMVLTGLYNMGEVPFSEVYITPKILDGYGETMSKSKGNGVDPIDVIDKFGADALRFGIAYLTTDTQDVKMPVEFECPHCQALIPQTKKNRTLPRVECEKCGQAFRTQWAEKAEDKALPKAGVSNERFELGRRFCNKLWNASRFSLMNLEGYKAGDAIAGFVDTELLLEDRWILSRLATVTKEVTELLETYRFAEASRALYAFAWNDFCDYYVEITKARFKEAKQRAVAQRLLAHVLDSLLRLLHPMVPFLTEEVWQLLGQVAPIRGLPSAASKEESICIASWPTSDVSQIDATIEEQFADFQAVLGAVREIRMGQNIPPRTPIEFRVTCKAATAKLLEPMRPYFAQIADATCTALGPDVKAPERTVSKSLGEIDVHVDVSQFFDPAAEKARLTKELTQLQSREQGASAKLANENFVSRAKPEVVEQQRASLEEIRRQIESVGVALAKLG